MDWRDALQGFKEANADTLRPDDTPTPARTDLPQKAAQRGKLTVSMERKGRGGKTATIISGFTVGDDEVARIAASLKKRLATGGSARGGEILIQGDRRTDVAAALRDMGMKV